ncbi:hypothetical protein FB381_2833 [Nocardioides albertanoniae]|uniref:Uncharacterized protein n=1 Tax=Nocardioides albertanoniae TaxID=1175486 RepID=A0A543A8L2_9ACTN|nr:DUF6766 family protein [Nocardioides albertanoniae]TQL68932.1 hypothetical protein FB381_2833 [Nocardioides albertanoniae]
MHRFIKENSLSIVFALLFVAALAGQAFAGWQQLNDELFAEDLHQLSLGRYLTSADFAVDVTENWQSEYLQFLLYIVFTVWLLQRGSPESKPLHKTGEESDEAQKVGDHSRDDSPRLARVGGIRTALYSRSLGIVMGAIFLLSWLVQSVAGWAAYNETRLQQLRDPIPWGSYLMNADFWARTLQNWQSEFLAVGSMAVLAIYLRQRGSPESKPVGAPHDATGVEG